MPVSPAWATPAPINAADQRMAGRGRDAFQPGDDVPEHRADQRPEHDRRGDQILVDQALADRVRDLVKFGHRKRQEIGGEIEEGGEGDRLGRAEQPGRDHGCNRIGGVVQAVQKIERKRDAISPTSSGKASSCMVAPLRVVDDDAVDLVGDVLEGVRHPLQIPENLAGDRELQRARSSRPPGMPASGRRHEFVRLAFQPDQSLGQFVQPAPLPLTSRSSGIASAVIAAASEISPTISFISGRSSRSS